MVFLTESGANNKTSIVFLLLIGIAINTLFLSGVGSLSYIARNPQARSITFWNLGTLSGSNWHSVSIVGIAKDSIKAVFRVEPDILLMRKGSGFYAFKA